MFGSRITKIEDKITSYEKYPTITSDMRVLDEHKVSIHIKDWCLHLIPALRYMMLVLKPTTRMNTSEAECHTNDEKLVKYRLVLYIQSLCIDSTVPCNRFHLHRSVPSSNIAGYKTFEYVTSHDITFYNDDQKIDKKIVNKIKLIALGVGCSLDLVGEVKVLPAIIGNVKHQGINLFARNVTEKNHDNGTITQDGVFSFLYTDNIEPKAFLRWAFEELINIVTESLKSEINNHYGQCSIRVNRDRSSFISNLIDHYLFANQGNRKEIINTRRESINNKYTMMTFMDIKPDELSHLLDATLKAITADLKALIADL
jgi:hypothetical protein